MFFIRYITFIPFFALLLSACGPEAVSTSMGFLPNGFAAGGFFYEHDEYDVSIQDVRKTELRPSIENNGFTLADFRDGPLKKPVFDLLESVRSAANSGQTLHNSPEVEKAIQTTKPAFEKAIFAWGKETLENKNFDAVLCNMGAYRDTAFSTKSAKPIPSFHIDFFEYHSMPQLFRTLGIMDEFSQRLGNEAATTAYWNKNRLANVLNFWMPLKEVNAYPLAVIDTQSLSEGDVIETAVRVDEVGNNLKLFRSAAPKYNSNQRYYYFSKMQEGEALAFKTFATPHAAFELPNQTGNRQSLDIRCYFINTMN